MKILKCYLAEGFDEDTITKVCNSVSFLKGIGFNTSFLTEFIIKEKAEFHFDVQIKDSIGLVDHCLNNPVSGIEKFRVLEISDKGLLIYAIFAKEEFNQDAYIFINCSNILAITSTEEF